MTKLRRGKHHLRKPFSEETKKKLALLRLGKTWNDEVKKKIGQGVSRAFSSKKHVFSKDKLERLSRGQIGKHTYEKNKEYYESLVGKKKPPEIGRKISESLKKFYSTHSASDRLSSPHSSLNRYTKSSPTKRYIIDRISLGYTESQIYESFLNEITINPSIVNNITNIEKHFKDAFRGAVKFRKLTVGKYISFTDWILGKIQLGMSDGEIYLELKKIRKKNIFSIPKRFFKTETKVKGSIRAIRRLLNKYAIKM